MDIHGFCDERFAKVRDAFERNFTEYGDVGATFAATAEGEFVVDLWAGHADKARTRPWQEDTIVNVYSTTKTMSFLCAFVLADRGQLDSTPRSPTTGPSTARTASRPRKSGTS